MGDGANRPIFDSSNYLMKPVLQKFGWPVVETTHAILKALKEAGIEHLTITPQACREVLRKCGSHYQDRRCSLTESPFQENDTLLKVVSFCFEEKTPSFPLTGFPFLLTQDGNMGTFSCSQPVCTPDYSDLLPDSSMCFVDSNLFKSLVPDKATIPKEFMKLSIEKFAEKLPKTQSVEPVWLNLCWQFFRELITDGVQPDEIITHVGDWCLLPVDVAGKSQLFAINQARDVLYDELKLNSDIRSFASDLKDAGVPWLNCLSGDDVHTVGKMLVTTGTNPDGIARLLLKYLPTKKAEHLRYKASDILNYFQNNLVKLKDKNILRGLTLFTNMKGEIIALNNCAVYVLHEKVPTVGMDIFNRKDIIFLRGDKNLTKLYSCLGCHEHSVFLFYKDFVLQQLEYLDKGMMEIHMKYIYDTFLEEKSSLQIQNNYVQERQRYIDLLSNTAFLANPDDPQEFHLPRQFHCRNDIFVLFSDNLAPNPAIHDRYRYGNGWDARKWDKFLELVGVVQELTEELFIEYAVGLSNQNHHNEQTAKKSKMLVKWLFRKLSKDNLKRIEDIRRIPFILKEECDRNLTDVCAPSNESMRMIAFEGSTCSNHECIIWTQASVLPGWADPATQILKNTDSIMKMLGIVEPPPMLVAENIRIMSESLLARSELRDLLSNPAVGHVFIRTFQYLKDMEDVNKTMYDKLANIRMIHVNNTLVLARKTVSKLPKENEIQPFLNSLPDNLAQYSELFMKIGATETPTTDQYITVLSDIHEEAGNGELNDQQYRDAVKASIGLFHVLGGGSKDVEALSLYLPSEKGHIRDARNLMFNDSSALFSRLRDCEKIDFVVDFRDDGITVTKALKLLRSLPPHLQPQYLTEYTQEIYTDNGDECKPSETITNLNTRINSYEFGQMVVRLLHHQNILNQNNVELQALWNLVEPLSVIRVYCRKQITTHLLYSGKKIIPNSEQEKPCFHQKMTGAKSGMDTWSIFVRSQDELDNKLLVPFAAAIDDILDNKLGKSVLYLLPILQCPNEEDMRNVLDSYNITDDHSSKGHVDMRRRTID